MANPMSSAGLMPPHQIGLLQRGLSPDMQEALVEANKSGDWTTLYKMIQQGQNRSAALDDPALFGFDPVSGEAKPRSAEEALQQPQGMTLPQLPQSAHEAGELTRKGIGAVPGLVRKGYEALPEKPFGTAGDIIMGRPQVGFAKGLLGIEEDEPAGAAKADELTEIDKAVEDINKADQTRWPTGQPRPKPRPDETAEPAGGLSFDAPAAAPGLGDTGFDASPTASPSNPPQTSAARPTGSDRATGSSGSPAGAGLAEDAEEAEEKLNWIQRKARDWFGVDSPEARQKLGTAIMKGGSRMQQTPGGFLEQLGAGVEAGIEHYTEADKQAWEREKEKELLELRKQEAAQSRAKDALAAEKTRIEIRKLEEELRRAENPAYQLGEAEQQALRLRAEAVKEAQQLIQGGKLDPAQAQAWIENRIAERLQGISDVNAADKGKYGQEDLLGGLNLEGLS